MNRSTTTGWLVTALTLIIVVGLVGAGFSALPSWDTLIRRSTTANQLTLSRGVGFDGGMGKLPLVQEMDQVGAEDDDYIMVATAVPTAAATSVTSFANSTTDVYRTLTAVGTDATIDGSLTIYGTDWSGSAQSETVTLDGTTSVDTNKPFTSVNMIVIAADSDANGNVKVGIGSKLGLYRSIAVTADVTCIDHKATADTSWTAVAGGALPSGASVSATYNTVQPETTITANDAYKIYYNASAW